MAFDAIAAIVSAVGVETTGAAVAAGAADLLGSTTAASILGGALTGAGGGALLGAVTGGNIGQDALLGAFGGGAISGLGPLVGETLGVGATTANALVGAGAGALGSAATGKNALAGALGGGLSGVLAGTLGGSGTGTTAGGVASGANPLAGDISSDLTGATAPISSVTSAPLENVPGATSYAPSNVVNLPATDSFAGSVPAVNSSPLVNQTSPLTGTAPPSIPNSLSAGASNNYGYDPSQEAALSAKLAGPAPLDLSSIGVTTGGLSSGKALLQDLSSANFGPSGALGDIGNILSNNPGAVVGALGLGYNALNQPKLPSVSSQIGNLESQANALSAQGSQLSSYLFNGTLPPGAQAAVNQATLAAKAKVRSSYAGLGLSGSSMEAEALANIDQQQAALTFNLADQLLGQGLNATGLSSSLYQSILQTSTQSQAQLQSSIANFAAALAGSNARAITINAGQGS